MWTVSVPALDLNNPPDLVTLNIFTKNVPVFADGRDEWNQKWRSEPCLRHTHMCALLVNSQIRWGGNAERHREGMGTGAIWLLWQQPALMPSSAMATTSMVKKSDWKGAEDGCWMGAKARGHRVQSQGGALARRQCEWQQSRRCACVCVCVHDTVSLLQLHKHTYMHLQARGGTNTLNNPACLNSVGIPAE